MGGDGADSAIASGCSGSTDALAANGAQTRTPHDPAQLMLGCDHIISAIIHACAPSAQAALMATSKQLHDLAGPALYTDVRVDAAGLVPFFTLHPGSARWRSIGAGKRRAAPRKSKSELLAGVRVLTLESHGHACALCVPAATHLTRLDVLHLVPTATRNGYRTLCPHGHCELLLALRPRKIVMRNLNGSTRLPLDLRWPLPESVDTVVLFLPQQARHYYYPSGEPLPHLAQSISGNLRLVPNIKIVFWDDSEADPASEPVSLSHTLGLFPSLTGGRGYLSLPDIPRTFLGLEDEYRGRRIVVDHLVTILQHAVCTNHKPWPHVTVYGFETLGLKTGSGSALARQLTGIPDPHELAHHALSLVRQHVLVPSPRSGQKIPYDIPPIVWEDIEAYEETEGEESDDSEEEEEGDDDDDDDEE